MRKVVTAILTHFAFLIAIFAQSNNGRLVGTVTGPDGVIAGAAILVTDNQTGIKKTFVSSSDGGFIVPQLEVGTYTVQVTVNGFKSFTANEVKIDVGREYSLPVTLEVGRVEDSVTVTAGTDIVNTTTGELSSTVSPRQVLELPLNGRNPLSLVSLQAGTAGGSIINGGRTSSMNFTRDGINVQDIFIRNGFVADTPTVDNTGEFTVVTLNAGAEQGYGSSQIQLVTPRGGQNIHGALWLYNRNSNFAANRFFSNAAGRFVATDAAVIQGRAAVGDPRQARPFLNRNQFGGKVSGPLPLPRFGEGGSATLKDKAFFFFSYEKFILRQQTAKTTTILLPNARNGIFSYRPTGTPAAGQCITFTNGVCTVNILNGTGLTAAIPSGPNSPQGILPADPIIQNRFLSRVPTAGNRSDLGDGLNTTGFGFNQSDPEDRREYTGRVDVQVTERNSINGIYRFNRTADARTDIDNSYNQTAQARTNAPVKFMSLGWDASYGRFSNQVRGGFQYVNVAFINDVLPTDSFLLGGLLLATNPEVTFRDQGRDTKTVSYSDNATLVFGKHALRFGGDMQRFKVRAFNFANVGTPTYSLAGVTNPNTPRLPASLFPGGIALSDQNNADSLRYLLAGIVGGGNIAANVTSRTATSYTPGAKLDRNLAYNTYAGYIGDQWRVAPQFTLNIGLRYELYSSLKTTDGLYLEPVLGNDLVASILSPTGTYDFVGRNSGKEGEFVKPDRNNFVPNISFAYTPSLKNKVLGTILGDGKTVFRGGYRMGYVNDEYIRSIDNTAGGNLGLTATATALQSGSPFLNARFNSLPAPTVPGYLTPPRTYADNNTAAIAGRFGLVGAIDPNLQIQKTHEYNFGIQREIGFQTALEVRYVGARSNQMVRSIDYNQVDIRANGFGADFLRALQNRRNSASIDGDAACLAAGTCQQLTVINNLTAAGKATVASQVLLGTPAETATTLIQAGNTGTVRFLPNLNTGVANLITNGGSFYYNSLQAELRRRLASGLYFQANYTFQKILTDVPDDGVNQSRVSPYLDNQNQRLDYSRASYDRTHTFNFNGIYELPFGQGKKFLNNGGFLNQVFGGWQLTSIVQISSGAPLSFVDARGTLNRGARSGNQTASSSLTKAQIKDLIGYRNVSGSLYYIDPAIIAPSGRAANGFGSATFAGQTFFNVNPLQTGNVERLFINGPLFWNWDSSLFKNFKISESARFQIRAEAFNTTNSTVFASPTLDINSVNFGKLTGTSAPRIIQFVGRLEF